MEGWPADKVERRPVKALIPYARNARTHTAAQVDQIAASIREWGWTNPVLVDDDGTIIAGHGRVLAAQKLDIAIIPVMVASGWSDAQKKAYVIADNKLAENAGWDNETLALELADLQLAEFDLQLMGFGEKELEELLAPKGSEGLTDENEVPEAPEAPISKVGDLWHLGNHRVLCGDSTVAADVERLRGGVEPLLMVTDPPYGVEYDPTWRDEFRTPTPRSGKVSNDDQSDWREAWMLFPGDVAYVWHAAVFAAAVAESLIASNFKIRAQIVWAKEHLVMGRGDYHWQHEPCWYAVRKGGTGHWNGDRKQTTLWRIDNKLQDAKTTHGTQKPVECMRRPIINNSSPGQAVYDPFLGSGTTVIAAETTGRVCLGIELNPAYVDVIVKRWQDFTGKRAVHADSGLPFGDSNDTRQETDADTPQGGEGKPGKAKTKPQGAKARRRPVRAA